MAITKGFGNKTTKWIKCYNIYSKYCVKAYLASPSSVSMTFQTFIFLSISKPDFDVEHFDWLLMIDE